MKLIRLKDTTDNHFEEAWKLYTAAFPVEERKTLEDQIGILQNDRYHFDIVSENDQFLGFILWWDFDTFRYVDHFATSKAHRNRGIGQLILEKFIAIDNKQIILEVELPSSSINERRIKFYKRVGFKLNDHDYQIPPKLENQAPLKLLIMSYPDLITKEDVDLFINKYHPIIFNKN